MNTNEVIDARLFSRVPSGSKITYLKGEEEWTSQFAGALGSKLETATSVSGRYLILFGEFSEERIRTVPLPEEMTLPAFKLIPVTT